MTLTDPNQVNKRLMHKAEKTSLLSYKNCKNQVYLTLVVIIALILFSFYNNKQNVVC